MLEFVHLTGADAGKDAQTRRKVRSQAMRDYRRRQRQSREASTKTSQSPQPSRSSARRGTLVNQERLQSVSPGSSTSWSLPHVEGIHVDDAGHPGTSTYNPDREYALPMGTSARTASEGPHGRRHPNVNSQDVETSRPPAKFLSQQTIPGALSSTESLRWNTHETSTWYNDMDDHFQSPELVNVMFNFCQSCALATAATPLCQACTDALSLRRPMVGSSDLMRTCW
nr:hypothetical protein CFP56_21657 [Quercus suber]